MLGDVTDDLDLEGKHKHPLIIKRRFESSFIKEKTSALGKREKKREIKKVC